MKRGLVILLVLASCARADQSGTISIATGLEFRPVPVSARKAAPSFSEEALTGGPAITQAIYAGKVGVVNFWGSWCGPCRKEEPLLERLSQEYAPRGVTFLGVNTRRDQRAAAKAFLEEFSVTYPSLYDPDSTVAFRFGVRVMPATFVIDRQGRIAAQIIGAITDEVGFRTLLDAESS